MDLFFLLLLPFFFAFLFKLAAFLYGRLHVSWLHALVFGLLAMLVGGGGGILNRTLLEGRVPELLAAVVALAVQVALAGWYFGPRAVTASGAPAGFGRGAVLALIAFALVFAIGVGAAFLVPLVGPAGRS